MKRIPFGERLILYTFLCSLVFIVLVGGTLLYKKYYHQNNIKLTSLSQMWEGRDDRSDVRIVPKKQGPDRLTKGQLRADLIWAGWPDHLLVQAMKVVECESGRRPGVQPKNKNGTKDTGLAQINDVHKEQVEENGWTTEDLKDPKVNLNFAYQLYREQGWRPWKNSNNCHGLLNPKPLPKKTKRLASN